ncbi:hypothetical protein KKB41_02360 [Patescibacteria group bacterium]|nr:hypothetical protein [Patescibacteria group bacterium]
MKREMVGDVPGNVLGMFSDLAHKLQHGSLTPEELSLFLQRKNPFSEPIFQRMLEACKFDSVNDNITHTQENFPILEEPDEDTEYVLVHLNRRVSTEEAEAEIKEQGFVSGTLADLLLYVRKNPDKQKEFPIIALGSRWQHSGGNWYSPYAHYWDGRRHLYLHWREGDWGGHCRFLARKPR